MSQNEWPTMTPANLADLLNSLSTIKTSQISRHFCKSKVPKTPEAPKTFSRSTIFSYLAEYQVDRMLNMTSCFSWINPDTDQANLMVNPHLLCFHEVQQFYWDLFLPFPLPSHEEDEDEKNHRSNACLVYFHQKLTHDPVKKKAKEFYSIVKHRNNSIKKMINYPSSQAIHYLRLDFELSRDVKPKFSEYFQQMSLCRQAILTHLRNHFKDQTALQSCKYLWRVNINTRGELSFTIHVMSNAEAVAFSAFQTAWCDKLQSYLATGDWKGLKLSSVLPPVREVEKKALLGLLLEAPTYITISPKDEKKSVFGLGGLGGRKYK